MPDKRGGRSFVSAAGSGGGGGGSGGTPLQPPSNGSWAQAAWWIDPANSSGVASDGNSGLDSGHPVRTWKGGVIARYGTLWPVLRQNVTYHWMSSQTDNTDPVIFYPFAANGAQLTMTGIDGQTAVATISLSGVVAKNRSTPQLLQATLGAARTVGMMLLNTTRFNPGFGFVSSTAWVLSLVSGTTWNLTQPLDTFQGNGTEDPDDVDTWANTDSVNIVSLPTVNLCAIEPRVLDWNGGFSNAFQVQRITVLDPAVGPGFDDFVINTEVSIQECWTQRCVLVGAEAPSNGVWGTAQHINVFAPGGVCGGVDNVGRSLYVNGGYINFAATTPNPTLIGATFDNDCIIAGTPYLKDTIIGLLYLTNTVELMGLTNVVLVSAGVNTGAIWGPGGFDVYGPSRLIVNSGTATAVFLNKGVIRINSQSNASAYDNTVDPAAWHSGRTLSAANLDASIMTGGFGSVAINPAGGSIIVGTIS